MGVVFQDFRLVDHLSAFDNVALPLRVSGVREADLQRLGIDAGERGAAPDADQHVIAFERLRPGGMLAFQVPANFDHPSHVLVGEVADALALTIEPDPDLDRIDLDKMSRL